MWDFEGRGGTKRSVYPVRIIDMNDSILIILDDDGACNIKGIKNSFPFGMGDIATNGIAAE